MNEECKAMREMYWSEIDDKTRINRLRHQVKNLQREVSMLNKVMRFIQSHSHAQDGSVVIPLFMRDEPQLTDYHFRPEQGDDVFF